MLFKYLFFSSNGASMGIYLFTIKFIFIGVHETHASVSLVLLLLCPLIACINLQSVSFFNQCMAWLYFKPCKVSWFYTLVESKKVLCYQPSIFRLTYSFKPVFIYIKRIDNILNKQMALFGCEGVLLGEKAFKCLNTNVLKRKLVKRGNPVKHKMWGKPHKI